MPNRKQHILVGAGVGMAADLYLAFVQGRRVGLGELVCSAAVGGLGARLPDLLEPAVDPAHRDVFHSLCTFAGMAYLMAQVWPASELTMGMGGLLSVGLTGYASHLMVDSRTPAGLPFLTRRRGY